jgi:hypothetical protein
MRAIPTFLLPIALLMFQASAFADPGKDESGHGKKGHGYDRREYRDENGHGNRHGRGHDRREYKEEYVDGNCKVERKYEKNGEYKEERKCSGPRQGYREQPRRGYYEQPPVYVPAPPVMYEDPGTTIRGTIRIP